MTTTDCLGVSRKTEEGSYGHLRCATSKLLLNAPTVWTMGNITTVREREGIVARATTHLGVASRESNGAIRPLFEGAIPALGSFTGRSSGQSKDSASLEDICLFHTIHLAREEYQLHNLGSIAACIRIIHGMCLNRCRYPMSMSFAASRELWTTESRESQFIQLQ